MTALDPFHLSLCVDDLALARTFYGETLGCEEGRSANRWVDYFFFGHQLSLHLGVRAEAIATAVVDGITVPVPHFGIVLGLDDWTVLSERLSDRKVPFIIEPTSRFIGRASEQATMFFLDPAGNALEIKAMVDRTQLFSTDVAANGESPC